MSLANFNKNILNGVREENFRLATENKLIIEERISNIKLYDRHFKEIKTFLGHIEMHKYLESL